MTASLPRLIPQPKSIRMLGGPGGRVERGLIAGLESGKGEGRGAAYRLRVADGRVRVEARPGRARFHAAQTLRQLEMNYGAELPALEIDDAPDFADRGFMLDVSRGKVPRLKTLFRLVEWLGFLKYNQLQLYIEHTFAFERHPSIGRGHSPLTGEDIRKLDAHCRRHHIDLVPNLQSFGHATHILKHRRYAGLAESDFRGGWTLSPAEAGTYRLLEELYEEFLPNFSRGRWFNVGCDETWDLGKGKSAAMAARGGVGRVYLEHVKRVRRLAAAHGRRIMMWGDIMEKHAELIGELPRDVTLLHWEYEAGGGERAYRKRLDGARRAGRAHYVCAGTSAWNSLFFRKTNARGNLRAMAAAGRWSGARGYLVTDWGDNGHYNPLGASLWAIAYGADCAWRAEPERGAERDFDGRFAAMMLGDRAGAWVEPLDLLGDLYLEFGARIPNNSPDRWLLTGVPEGRLNPLRIIHPEIGRIEKIGKRELRAALERAEGAAQSLRSIRGGTAAIEGVRREWLLAAEGCALAARRGLMRRGGEEGRAELKRAYRRFARRFEEVWLASNRRSDLASNLRELTEAGRML